MITLFQKSRLKKQLGNLWNKGLKNKLVCICPNLDGKEKTSISYVKLFLEGKYPGAPDFSILVSDMKDVVKAHINSLTRPDVGGRRLNWL